GQMRGGPDVEKALDLLMDHAQSKQMSRLCQVIANSMSPKADKLLRTVMEKNADTETQASAAFALTQNLLFRADRGPRGNAADRQQLSQEAEKVFVQALATHTDSKQLAPLAQQLGNSRNSAAPKLLRLILEKSKNPDAQGFACMGLATYLKNQSEK